MRIGEKRLQHRRDRQGALVRQTNVSARSPCRSMTASSLPQRPVRASVAFSVSIASRRTVPGRVLARDRATIRWAADGGFGDRVGCIPPDRPMSQGYPGCLTATSERVKPRSRFFARRGYIDPVR